MRLFLVSEINNTQSYKMLLLQVVSWHSRRLVIICIPESRERFSKRLLLNLSRLEGHFEMKRRVCFLILMAIGMFVNEVTIDFSCLFEHQYKRLYT
jgi:hypothetical protein